MSYDIMCYHDHQILVSRDVLMYTTHHNHQTLVSRDVLIYTTHYTDTSYLRCADIECVECMDFILWKYAVCVYNVHGVHYVYIMCMVCIMCI